MDLPREDALRWLVKQYAHLRHSHGDAIGDPDLLEPSGRHFPDPFSKDGPSVARLFTRPSPTTWASACASSRTRVRRAAGAARGRAGAPR